MRIAGLQWLRFENPLRAPAGPIPREGLLLRVLTDDGGSGLGEVAPLPGFNSESREDALGKLALIEKKLPGAELPEDPSAQAAWLADLSREHDLPPALRFGLGIALADRAARRAGLSLARWLDPRARQTVPVNAVLLGHDASIAESMAALEGFGTFKLKVGGRPAAEDHRRIKDALRALPPAGRLRLDANLAWNFEQAVEALAGLNDAPVEYVEEPLRVDEQDRLDDLHAETGLAFALDETFHLDTDLDRPRFRRLLASEAVVAAIVKPAITGGPEESRLLCEQVAALGKRWVFTAVFDSGVGLAACLHLAAAHGDPGLPCGLDTLRHLERSLITEDLIASRGELRTPAGPGLGVSLAAGFDRGGWS